MPTLKGTEASLSYVHCFFFLVSSSVKVSICHSMWLDTFWTGLILPSSASGCGNLLMSFCFYFTLFSIHRSCDTFITYRPFFSGSPSVGCGMGASVWRTPRLSCLGTHAPSWPGERERVSTQERHSNFQPAKLLEH